MAEPKENRDVKHNASVDKGNEEEDTRPSLIMLLNDFCCLKIFELLPLAELYAVCRTCTRFEVLCADVFCRRYPNKAIVIDNISDKGKVHQGLQDKYAKYFTKYIPNVTLAFGEDPTQDLIRLCKFYDGSSPIKSVQLKKWRAKLEASHGAAMCGIVETIESVTFTGMEIDGDVYANMLQFMPNMKSLTFRQTFEKSGSVDLGWTEKAYPKLEYFAWYETLFPAAELMTLFDRNCTIRHFSLLATLHETIEQLMDSSIRVDELFIDFDRFNHVKRECSDTLKCLLALCKRQPDIRLHMKCDEGSRYYLCQHFVDWKPLAPYIEGLYFLSVEEIDGIQFTGPRLHAFIFDCKNLKVLQLNHDCSINWTMLTPKLERVFFYYNSSYNDAIRNVAYRAHRLKTIHSDTTRKLKIYISSIGSNPIIENLNDDGASIEVARSETEIVNNPLVSLKERRIKHKGPRAEFTELDRAMLRFIYS